MLAGHAVAYVVIVALHLCMEYLLQHAMQLSIDYSIQYQAASLLEAPIWTLLA